MGENLKETVLITGANGFVGSRLCRRLINNGYDVIAGVRLGCDISRIERLVLQYRFGDVENPESLLAMTSGVDYIVHNAGLVKTTDINNFYKINQQGTKNILDAAAKNQRLKKFIYISSMAAAGPSPIGRPLIETDPARPITVYGQSKRGGEEAVTAVKDKINSVILRPSGIYGPGDREMFAFFETLNNRIKPYLGNLKRRIQLTYVDDLALAVSRSLSASTVSGSIYFIAESRSYSYCELVKCLRMAVGRVAIPVYLPGWGVRAIAGLSENIMKLFGRAPMFTIEKANEILCNWEVATQKAKDELGFEAEMPFPEGARETCWWYRLEGWL